MSTWWWCLASFALGQMSVLGLEYFMLRNAQAPKSKYYN
jgi:hypothetical protein